MRKKGNMHIPPKLEEILWAVQFVSSDGQWQNGVMLTERGQHMVQLVMVVRRALIMLL